MAAADTPCFRGGGKGKGCAAVEKLAGDAPPPSFGPRPVQPPANHGMGRAAMARSGMGEEPERLRVAG